MYGLFSKICIFPHLYPKMQTVDWQRPVTTLKAASTLEQGSEWDKISINEHTDVDVSQRQGTLRSAINAGLHRNANTNAACKNDAYVHVGKFIDCLAFVEAANQPNINVLYANSLWCTDSRRIAFGCLPNVHHTAECCLPRLRNTSTSNVRIVFACRVRVPM